MAALLGVDTIVKYSSRFLFSVRPSLCSLRRHAGAMPVRLISAAARHTGWIHGPDWIRWERSQQYCDSSSGLGFLCLIRDRAFNSRISYAVSGSASLRRRCDNVGSVRIWRKGTRG